MPQQKKTATYLSTPYEGGMKSLKAEIHELQTENKKILALLQMLIDKQNPCSACAQTLSVCGCTEAEPEVQTVTCPDCEAAAQAWEGGSVSDAGTQTEPPPKSQIIIPKKKLKIKINPQPNFVPVN